MNMFAALGLVLPVLSLTASLHAPMSPLMLEAMKVMSAPVRRVAVLCRPSEAALVGRLAGQFPVAVTLWTCVNDRDCHRHFVRFVTEAVDFPGQGLIVVPRHTSLPPAVFRQVSEFQKYHSNVNWIFSVEKHSDVLDKLINSSCHVVTVNDSEINAPYDYHVLCERRTVLTMPNTLLSENLPPAGTYPKNEVINYASQDGPSRTCTPLHGNAVKAAMEAYVALNNTLVLHCNKRKTSNSILLERRVDLLLGTRPVNCPLQTPCFFYGYSMYSPTDYCFLTRRGNPMYPSFVRNWISFLKLALILTPSVALFILLLRIQSRLFPRDVCNISVACDFLLSTFLGRSPPPGMTSNLTSTKVSVLAWTVGMFFLFNFIQMEITASRSVPSFSAEIRHMRELAAKFDSGEMLPCVSDATSRTMLLPAENVSYLGSLRRALEACGKRCMSYGSHTGCYGKLQSGVYAGIAPFRASTLASAQKKELVLGKETFLTFLRVSPAHGRYRLRYQHRRLLLAVEESGILQRIEARGFTPIRERQLISFNVPFYDYMLAYIAGIGASFVALLCERVHSNHCERKVRNKPHANMGARGCQKGHFSSDSVQVLRIRNKH